MVNWHETAHMDTDPRANLLRLRFASLFPLAAKPHPKAKPVRIWTPSKPFKTDDICDAGSGIGAKRPKWMKAGDPKPKKTVATKHRDGVPALALIAAKAPEKLVRVFRNAEVLLAARARR